MSDQASQSDSSPPSWELLLKGNNFLNSFALAGGVALHATDVYITISILPTIVKDIGGVQFYAWNTVLYIVASIIGSALSSKVLQATTPKRAFNYALLAFGIGSLICTLTPSMPLMLAGRFVQGFGGGMLFALAYAMIQILFEPSLWPRAMGLISAMWGIATLLGPAVGGFFAEFGHWRAAFGTIVLLTLCYSVITNIALKKYDDKSSSAEAAGIPFARLFLLVASVLSVSVGSLYEEPSKNFLGIFLGGIFIIMLVVSEKRPSATRILPTNSFSLKHPLLYLYALMALLILGSQSEVFIPLFLQKVHNQPPFASGYIAALIAAGWAFSSIALSGLSDVKKIKGAIFFSPVIMLAGSVGLSVFMPDISSGIFLVAACLIVVGAGIGIGHPYVLTQVFIETPENEKEVAASSVTTVQLFFTSLGSAIAGAIVNFMGMPHASSPEAFSVISRAMFAVFAVFPVVAVLLALKVSSSISSQTK